MLRAHDAFLYHVHTVERGPEFDLEGVTQNALAANASPAEEAKQVNWVVSQEPDVLLVTSVEDPKSAVDLAKFSAWRAAGLCRDAREQHAGCAEAVAQTGGR